ncbi:MULTISPECIES: hypothetical protein [Pseudomonas syringae group]|uniref:hypothetical protein n=1 Tax=Pseudomonas syringae group TaxID=136849 RepID=UPI000291A0BD|nr:MULTISPECIES: hypothetical protein [Pseudomonas syringae group]EKN47547.1 hypothetical protein AAI_06136 [Pseudomonas viridiflava UASWS0038]KPL66514.1 hypothetical protein PVFL_00285 [Pseudomonas viridiflava]OAG93006.1 hypothetical protein AO065_08475 [Pseudomonas viridiflava]
MNQEAIDRLLSELLRIPPEQRTLNEIATVVADINAAALLEAVVAGPLQQEQIKLLAITKLLACELQMVEAHVTLELHPTSGYRIPLSLTMRSSDGGYVFGSGETAQEALMDIHDYLPQPKEAVA